MRATLSVTSSVSRRSTTRIALHRSQFRRDFEDRDFKQGSNLSDWKSAMKRRSENCSAAGTEKCFQAALLSLAGGHIVRPAFLCAIPQPQLPPFTPFPAESPVLRSFQRERDPFQLYSRFSYFLSFSFSRLLSLVITRFSSLFLRQVSSLLAVKAIRHEYSGERVRTMRI